MGFWYIIYLNELYIVIINQRHLTVFVFIYIYFPKIAFIVLMWIVFLWLSMAMSDLLLWSGYWNIASSKMKGNILTTDGLLISWNVSFMQLVVSNPFSTSANSHV